MPRLWSVTRADCSIFKQPATPISCSLAGQSRTATTPSPQVQQLAKDKYAHTLFYLAQVYGMLGDKDQAATYCARTLSYQLELGTPLASPCWSLTNTSLRPCCLNSPAIGCLAQLQASRTMWNGLRTVSSLQTTT